LEKPGKKKKRWKVHFMIGKEKKKKRPSSPGERTKSLPRGRKSKHCADPRHPRRHLAKGKKEKSEFENRETPLFTLILKNWKGGERNKKKGRERRGVNPCARQLRIIKERAAFARNRL